MHSKDQQCFILTQWTKLLPITEKLLTILKQEIFLNINLEQYKNCHTTLQPQCKSHADINTSQS